LHLEFFASVESNIEKVEDFYNAKLQSSLGSLRNLRTDFWDAELSNDPLDQDEFNLLTGCLLELREKLLKLLLFANVNFRGFERISRKLDAAFPATNAAEPFLSSKVFPTAFAGNGSLGEALDFTEKWLSSLGYPNGRPSSVLARPRRVVSSRVMNTVDPDKLEAMETAIKNDIPVVLRNCQRGLQGNPGLAQALLQRCITHQARNSCSRMVQLVASAWSANVFKRNCLHQLVIFIARSEFEQLEAAGPPWAVPGQFPLHGKRYLPQDYQPRNNESICFLEYLLELRSAEWNWDPDAVDSEGRRHIHYAAEFGLVTVCDALLNHAQDFPGPHAQHEIDGAMWCDWEHMSPLHYSVANGNIRTAARLLQHRPEPGREPLSTGEKAIGDRLPSRIPVVALATRNDDIHMIILLLSAGRDANVQDVNGETPLHIAARLGFAACVKVLLNNGGAERTVDIADMSTWTPLFTAAANGNIGAVRPLLDAGADPNRLDATGWSAKEHAAYRGHLSISKLLPSPTSLEVPTRGSHRIGTAAVPPPDGIPSGIPSRETLQDPPIKEAMIVVCLGSMDTRKDAQPVELDPISADTKLYTQLNRPMALVVRATGAASNSTKFNLPLLEDISTEPVIFMTKDASQVKILFDIEARSGATSSGPLIGRGVALVSSLNGSILENRINLSGDFAVPITAADSLAVIGRANFNFIIVTPFSHPKADDVSDHSWRIKPRTVIGHRGKLSIPDRCSSKDSRSWEE
jgi:glycerophosphodiester phosphodiesterase